MAHPTAKDLLHEAADHLPEGASVDEAMERVLFLAKIERGKADVEASVGASRGALGPSSRRLPRPAGRSPHHHLA
jgi:hypothetical protein